MKNLKIRDSVQYKETGREFNNKNKKKANGRIKSYELWLLSMETLSNSHSHGNKTIGNKLYPYQQNMTEIR